MPRKLYSCYDVLNGHVNGSLPSVIEDTRRLAVAPGIRNSDKLQRYVPAVDFQTAEGTAAPSQSIISDVIEGGLTKEP